nr:hypothetical protein [candidate division KSB1 bacterium]NIS23059.1 hypothetical protein [candidate division KSB1 bacterium]NIT70124.1 hypothetical protein [candidate division KSB1 bacterium]NIU93168.1 hypothetical protein [candidate division KSB1 bacterium]NIW68208.1 hypothetical protein [candidate division KSB1 bacterium]
MELIGWVLRNRVKTQYLGDTTYEAVARRKHQFSGLNPYDKQYHTNVTMSYHDRNTAWQNALKVASEVYAAPEADRPFPGDVKHFYSPQSVARVPDWAR